MRGAEAWFVILFTFRVWTSFFRFSGQLIAKRRIELQISLLYSTMMMAYETEPSESVLIASTGL